MMETKMLSEMANVAAECFKNPNKESVWSPHLERYICPDSEEGQRAPASAEMLSQSLRLSPKFKLVFIASAAGTLLFIVICVGLHLYTEGQPPPALAKLIDGLLDMAKIGFGAVVGLLGSKTL